MEERSCRPAGCPWQTGPALERLICQLRTRHPHWGARRIRTELTRAGIAAPAVSTVHQVLKCNYLVAPRRPRARQRFEREHSNELWQIDAIRIVLSDQTPIWVVDLVDDHARLLLAALACDEQGGGEVRR